MAQDVLDRPTEPHREETVNRPDDHERDLPAGTEVEVRSRFDDRWSDGFEIVETVARGYRVKRLSDGAVLPATFTHDDVRRVRARKRAMWWY